MYANCSILWIQNLTNDRVRCLGDVTIESSTSTLGNYVTCPVDFQLFNTRVICPDNLKNETNIQTANPTDFIFQLDSFTPNNGYIRNPINYSTQTIETTNTNPSGQSTLLTSLTPSDYIELSTYTATILLLAYGIRLVRSLFVTSR